MNRFILFLFCLLIPWTARGQATYDGWYWFDGESVMRPMGTFRGDRLSMMADAGALDQGLHTIHIQVVDTAGVYSPVLTTYFFHVKDHAVKALRYWFDNDTEHVYDLDYAGTSLRIDVSALDPGLHNLYLQLVDASGNLSDVVHQGFYRTMRRDVLMWTYWFDDDESTMTTVPYPGKGVMIDVSGLTDGFHTMHNVVNDISQSAVETRMFVKVPQTEGVGYMDCICSVDGRLVSQEKLPARGGVMQWSFDVSSLDVGIHKAQFVTITPSGAASTVADRYFVRAVTDREMGTMKCFYSLDNFKTAYQAGTMSNGLFHFDLDVSEMEDGLHRLAYMLVSDNGITTPQQTAFFWKTPLGGSGITQYDYWLNQSENIHSVTLDKRVNPFSLVQLLPVESEPIRSACFHFEVKDGVPMMYALNDFHLAFYDATGRRVDESRQFIDYAVSRAVDDATPLDVTQTFERPAENDVKWFTFEAEKGDTIAFRSSQATSLQVFSPTSKEVYAALADQSVKFGGCHVWEDGTYYVAVHDVTGTKPNVTLDYMHMDRYAVVSQDVYTVGNGGASTLTFQGNGFDELESVNLAFDGQTIQADSIFHESNVTTSVRFNFTGTHIGKYSATFSFKDGIKVVENCVIVEEATPIVINETIRFDKQYLRTRTNEYIINLRNEGNSTAYDVPVVIGIFTPEHNQLNKVLIEGHDYYNQWKRMLPELFTPAFEDSLQNLYASEGLKPLFIKLSDVEYVSGNPAMHRAKLYVNLRPNTTETFKVCINASTTAHVFVWAPEQWETQASTLLANRRIRKTVIDDARCGIATAHSSRCEQNAMRIELGQEPIYTNIDCSDMAPPPGCPNPGGGSSTPVNSFDPNDIYGYTAESGSRYMTDKVQQVNYRIEFENDPEFATASAHVVEIRDTLNAKYFDLDSYAPTGIKIGDRTELLDGKPQFVRTIDMRPQINAITQVEGFYNRMKGIVTYRFTSIDPMTMEPTDDVMQGFLPVNVDGTSGIGEVSYNVNLLKTFADGTQISNRASIVFDTNDPILTPVWQNTIDAVSPVSKVTEVVTLNDSTARVHCEGTDERSGVWRYEVYAQYGSVGTWEKVGICKADSAWIDFPMEDNMSYGFCALAVDSAGNVEVKDMVREAQLVTCLNGDANGDGIIDIEDVVTAVSHFLGEGTPILMMAADVNTDGVIDIEDVVGISEIYLNVTPQAARLRSTAKRQRLREIWNP